MCIDLFTAAGTCCRTKDRGPKCNFFETMLQRLFTMNWQTKTWLRMCQANRVSCPTFSLGHGSLHLLELCLYVGIRTRWYYRKALQFIQTNGTWKCATITNHWSSGKPKRG